MIDLIQNNESTERPSSFTRKDRFYIICLTCAAFTLGLLGLYHYGYIGQDFTAHRNFILAFPQGYSFAATNPIGFYWLASTVRCHISAQYYLEITAFIFLVINTASLFGLYTLIWKTLYQWPLRYAAAALITFVPFRIVHSIVIAADAFTVPVFVVITLLSHKLLEKPNSVLTWLGLTIFLTVGILTKYTFVGMLPPVAGVMAFIIWKYVKHAKRIYWSLTAVVVLAVPSTIFLYSMHESGKVNGYTTSGHWLPKGAEPIMRWSDILTLKKKDTKLLFAPEYFRNHLYEDRKYSYIGLVHIGSFTDCLNYFQHPPHEISMDWHNRNQEDFMRTRNETSKVLQIFAVNWCIPFTILAILGTIYYLALAIPTLIRPSRLLSQQSAIMALLAAGFYAPIFLNLPRVSQPYLAGYWLPRLVMPSLIIFLILGFASVELTLSKLPSVTDYTKIITITCLVYTAIACILFAGFLC